MPTVLASNGAHTKKPLPMIDDSGVTVASQVGEAEKRFQNSSKLATTTTVAIVDRLVNMEKLQRRSLVVQLSLNRSDLAKDCPW